MNLRKKKLLAAKTLNVGKGRIVFLKPRLDEIKEAITKQDIRDLKKDGAIIIKEIKGRRTLEKVKRRRRVGKIKKRLNTRKADYITLTRNLRRLIEETRRQGRISREVWIDIRKKIKNRFFKNKAQLKEYLKNIK
jgi:large subunit ribosomal protein L19e